MYLLFCCTLSGWNNPLNQWNSEAKWAILAPPGVGLTVENVSCVELQQSTRTSWHRFSTRLLYLEGWTPFSARYSLSWFLMMVLKDANTRYSLQNFWRCLIGLTSGDCNNLNKWITAFHTSYIFSECNQGGYEPCGDGRDNSHSDTNT